MDLLNKEIVIPAYLWKLHGKKPTVADLAFTYGAAILAIISAWIPVNTNEIPAWKIGMLAVLAADIGGGVISNFTKSTKAYYQQGNMSLLLFIWLHVAQSILLCCLYTDLAIPVLAISLAILIFASIIITVKNGDLQRIMAIFLFVLFSMLLHLLASLPTPLLILLHLFALKLIVAFPIRWN